MNKEEAKNKAIENFKSGMNCAQAVSNVFAEQFGYDAEAVKKAIQPLGAGMCRLREVCGAFSGLLFCLGMKGSDSKNECYTNGQELYKRFIEHTGTINCSELIGLSKKGSNIHIIEKPIAEERTSNYYEKRPCAEICGIAAEVFQEWLDENKK